MERFTRTRKRLLVPILAVAVLAQTGCATFNNFKDAFFDDGRDPEETIRIGVFQPLSGKDSEYGELERIGIELANEYRPKVLGKEVELLYADNKSDIYIAELAIQDLIAKRPAIVLGSYGGVYSLIAAEFLEKARIPAIAITTKNPLVTSNNPYYFRVCYVDSFEGVAVAKYAGEVMGVGTAAILKARDDDYATAVSQVFQEKIEQITGNPNAIVSSRDYAPGETDFMFYLQTIINFEAEVVFLPVGVDDAAAILKQAVELNVDVTFLGTGEWDTQELVEKAGEEAASLVAFSTIFDPDTGITQTTNIF